MDNLSDQYKSNENHAEPFSAVMQTILGFVRWLTGYFTLSEEERLKAGINIGSQKRNE
jgi:hypothetical protein